LGYKLSYQRETDIQAKIKNFIKVTGIINSIFKPNLVQKHTRLGVYNVLAKPTLVSWSEAWTITSQDGKLQVTSEMRFKSRSMGYTILDKKIKNTFWKNYKQNQSPPTYSNTEQKGNHTLKV
jgi:hypothetical protein